MKKMLFRKNNLKKIIAKSLNTEQLFIKKLEKSSLLKVVQSELNKNPDTDIVVLNKYFTLDNLYVQQQYEFKDIRWQAPKVIIIDSKDFQESQIESFTLNPPRFCGEVLKIIIIEKEGASEDVLEDCEEVIFNSPLVHTIELDDNESAVLELLDSLESTNVYEKLEREHPIVIRHFQKLNEEEKQDIKAMIIAKSGAVIPGIGEQLSFHYGLLETEINEFTSLLTSEGVSQDSELVIVNSETINDLHHSLLIEGGEWQVGKGLLESIDHIQLLVTEDLSLKDWQLLFTIIKHEKLNWKVVDLTIQEGVAVPEGLETTLQSVSRTEKLGLNSIEVSDLSFELVNIKHSKRLAHAKSGAGYSIQENNTPVIVSVSESLSLEHLLGHVSLHQETKSAINPIENSHFYKALDSDRPIIFTNLNRNPRLSKQLEMLFTDSSTVSPSLYYLGKKYDFPFAKISIMNERRESLDGKITNLEEKLQQAIQDVLPDPDKYEGFKTDIIDLAKEVLIPLARDGYDHVLDYVYLKKLCRQVLVEQKWDKSKTITNYHLRKAFSTTIKEFKLSKCYKTYKNLVWEGSDKAKLEEAQKDLRAIIMNMIQDPVNSQSIPITAGGYSQLIENAVISNDFKGLPKKIRPKRIRKSKGKLDAGDRSEAILAKQRIKDRRLELKMKDHKVVLVLGPTGSGKTEQGLRIAREKGMLVTRATLGPATEPADLIGSLTTDPAEEAQIKFVPGKINEWLEKGGMLLLDEVTMVKNWDLFESYFEHGSFIIDGKYVVPPKGSVVYMTGNESGNGQYGGRHLPKQLRQHTMIVKKPGMSLDDLKTHIIDPLCQRNKKINGEDLSKKLFSIMQLSQELGVPDHVFSTREIKDIITQFIKTISGERAAEEIVVTTPYDNLFKLCRVTLMPLVAKAKSATLDTKLRAITDYQGHYDIDLKAQLMERAALLDQEDPSGLKPGIIMNGLGEDTERCLEALHDVDRFCFYTGGQWTELVETVRRQFELGKKLIVKNAHLVPTEFWESLVNEFMTEPRQGFMLILINSSPDEKWIAPSLRSRFAMITEKSKTPITAACVDVVRKRNNRLKHDSRWCFPWKRKNKEPKAFLSDSKLETMPHYSDYSKYLDDETVLAEELPMRMTRVYPDFPESYTREDSLHINYKTMLPNKKDSVKECLEGVGRVDSIPEAGTIKWTKEISLNFDDEGFAKFPSMSCYQRIEAYKTNNNSELDFFQDADGEFYAKQRYSTGKAPSILQLCASIPTIFINPEVSSKSEMPEEFREKLDAFFNTDEGKLIKNEIGIKDQYLRDVKIQKLDVFFQKWGHGETHFPTKATSVDKFLHLLKNKKGVCRHRALVGKVLCDYFGIPSRLEVSTNHAWLSVCGDDILWKRLKLHITQFQNDRAQRSETDSTDEVIPKVVVLPNKVTLPKPDSSKKVNKRLLETYTHKDTTLFDLLVKKTKGEVSTARGTLSLEKLSNESKTPFIQAVIQNKTKAILTDRPLPITLEKLFERAGIVTVDFAEILWKRGVNPITDNVLQVFHETTEIEGIDDYQWFSTNDIIEMMKESKMVDLKNIQVPHSTIEDVINNSNNLECLDLTLHDLSQVTNKQWKAFMNRNKTLKTLILENCNLTSIPDSIKNLTCLKGLFLNENKIKKLPKEIGLLTSLTELYLNFNQLTTLQEEIGELTALTHLGLGFNQLTTLPKSIVELKALKTLNLNCNNFLTFTEEIEELRKKENLTMCYYGNFG